MSSRSVLICLLFSLHSWPIWSEEPQPEHWVLDCAVTELTALPADLGLPMETFPAKEGPALNLLRGLTPAMRQSLLEGPRGHCLAAGRALLRNGRSQLNLSLSEGQFPYLQLDDEGQLRLEVVRAQEEVDLTTHLTQDAGEDPPGLNLRFQVSARWAVGRSPVRGLPGLAAGPPILSEQQTTLVLRLMKDTEILLLLGAPRAEVLPLGLLLRITREQEPGYTLPARARERRQAITHLAQAEADLEAARVQFGPQHRQLRQKEAEVRKLRQLVGPNRGEVESLKAVLVASRLAQTQADLAQARERFTEEHPKIQQMQATVEAYRTMLGGKVQIKVPPQGMDPTTIVHKLLQADDTKPNLSPPGERLPVPAEERRPAQALTGAGSASTTPEHLPEVLARVLPAVVRIQVEQPAPPPNPPNWPQQLRLEPGKEGRLRFHFEGPGQPRQFEWQLPPGQNWEQWLQQHPQGPNWWRQFFDPQGNGFKFFQNNVNDADKKPPRVLQVQPPDDEEESGPKVPRLPPNFRIQIPNRPQRARVPANIIQTQLAGCIIRPNGYIVTVHGARLREVRKIQVTIHDRRVLEGHLVEVDPLSDLAVLKIDAEDLTPIQFGDSDQVQVGEPIFSVGHPYGYVNTVSQGIISGRNRTLPQAREPARGLLQIDIPLAPGCSGGPVINLRGEVIGLNYAVFRPAEGGAPLSFALPSNIVSWVTTELLEKGKVDRAWLGVVVREVDEVKREALQLDEAAGALVQEVMKGSPAEAAGVQIFDVIQRVGDRPVRTANDLVDAIRDRRPGEKIELGLLRNGEEKVLHLNLGKLPPLEELQKVPRQLTPPGDADAGDGVRRPQGRTRPRRRLQLEVHGDRVQLKATNAPLQEVIKRLAAVTGVKVAVDPTIADRRITLQLDQPLEEALPELAETQGLVLEQAGEWQILREPG